MHFMRRLLLVGLLLFLAACSNSGTPSPSPADQQATTSASLWGAPITVAQTQQSDAPALVSNNAGLIMAWIGSDDRGVHQDARSYIAGQLNDSVTLPLPPTHPYDQHLYPGDNGNTQLLWLDAGQHDQNYLYSALLSSDLTVQRGPVSVSDGLALRYSAVSDGSGGLWVAWSGGQLSELTLYERHIDDQGRPLLESSTLASNADYPALVRTNGGALWAFWLSNGQLMRQELDPAGQAQSLTSAVSLATGDHLIDVKAALDATSAYFFWNITRADGTNETWLTAGSLSANVWRQPEKLQVKVDSSTLIDTGFKIGSITSAASGGSMALRWAEPHTDQYQSLAAAVESDAGLGVVTFNGGDVNGYTPAQSNVHLIGHPALAVAADGNFALAWSSPGSPNASLQLILTQK